MKTIYIDKRTKQEIDELRKVRGFDTFSINDFLHRLADAIERSKKRIL